MGIMFSIVYQRVSLKLCCVCCGRAGGNGRHSLDAFALKTSPSPSSLLLIYIYTPLPPQMGYARTLSPPLAPPPPENLHSVRGCPKKVEKTSSENTTFAKSEHPYRTCGSLGGNLFFFDFPIFDQKPIIPFVAVPKKSKKRQAKTPLLKIRSTPIALAALPADFSIFSVPPLCQFCP